MSMKKLTVNDEGSKPVYNDSDYADIVHEAQKPVSKPGRIITIDGG